MVQGQVERGLPYSVGRRSVAILAQAIISGLSQNPRVAQEVKRRSLYLSVLGIHPVFRPRYTIESTILI